MSTYFRAEMRKLEAACLAIKVRNFLLDMPRGIYVADAWLIPGGVCLRIENISP